MNIFQNVVQTEGALRKFHLALVGADALNLNKLFWSQILIGASVVENSATPQANLAIRTFVETKLSTLGPNPVMKLLSSILLNPSSDWSDLGIVSINDETAGMELTPQLKIELITLLDTVGAQFLAQLAGAIQLEIPEQFAYGHGYGYGCGLGIDYVTTLLAQ